MSPPLSKSRLRCLHRCAKAAKAQNNSPSPRLIKIAFWTTRSTYRLVFRAFFVLFGFVVFAQHFAIRIHFDANLLAILLNDGFKVGALLFPTDNCSAFSFCLGSLL